jgi:hypothetical protein
MAEARELLGPAGNQVQLLGIDANPKATAVNDVMAYSRAHGMVNQWDFLTGSPTELRAALEGLPRLRADPGRADRPHPDPVRDRSARPRAEGLPACHPKLASQRSLAHIGGARPPAARATLNMVPSGSVTLGPGRPHLVLFFATSLTETSGLRAHLTALNGYARAAERGKLPRLVAIDEAATEPSPGAVRSYLQRLGRPPGYPVALDTPPGGSPTAIASLTSRGSCSPPPPARSYRSTTAGSPLPHSRPPSKGPDLPRRLTERPMFPQARVRSRRTRLGTQQPPRAGTAPCRKAGRGD